MAASALCAACGLTDTRDGRIFAIDVDSASGSFTNVVAIFQFIGPGGASPVIVPNTVIGSDTGNAIFFDGLTHYNSGTTPNCSTSTGADDYAACFYAIFDKSLGSTPAVISTPTWVQSFRGATFQAGAARDPRGGIWVYPYSQVGSGQPPTCTYAGALDSVNCLIRLSESNGTKIGGLEIDLTLLINGLAAPTSQKSLAFMPSSALTLTKSTPAGSYYLTMGAMHAAPGNFGTLPSVVTVNVTSTPSLYSTTQTTVTLPTTPSLPSVTNGQFPVVTIGSHQKTVFTGKDFGPYFLGTEMADAESYCLREQVVNGPPMESPRVVSLSCRWDARFAALDAVIGQRGRTSHRLRRGPGCADVWPSRGA